MDEFSRQRILDIEHAITSVRESIYYALIDENDMPDGLPDGKTSIKRRLQWMFNQQSTSVKLLGGIYMAVWVIAITMVVGLIHHW